ncbi:hypothetical protein [Streptomyces achromogenes]|uniref:hypothetical protein n=1 Tax=Streptomyces achromogenes TaxID=67255 RepID=UPI0036C2FEF4
MIRLVWATKDHGSCGLSLMPYFTDAVASRNTHDAAAEYARWLARRTGTLVQSVPVSHSPLRRAVYRLVFPTRSPYGL